MLLALVKANKFIKDNNITQIEFAENCDMSKYYINRLLNNDVKIITLAVMRAFKKASGGAIKFEDWEHEAQE
jgi:transcriptional regulator with XRE-family HTH domain